MELKFKNKLEDRRKSEQNYSMKKKDSKIENLTNKQIIQFLRNERNLIIYESYEKRDIEYLYNWVITDTEWKSFSSFCSDSIFQPRKKELMDVSVCIWLDSES